MKLNKDKEIRMTRKNKKLKTSKGITVLALTITIIILLILSGITIVGITGENGIIQNAVQAKEETEISEEQEIVEQATIQTMGNNNRGIIEKDKLQSQLDNITGKGKTIVTEDKEEGGFFVKFIESGRIYKVSQTGEVKYLGIEETLLTQAEIIASPESNLTPELVQEVDLTVKTLIDIGDVDYTLVCAWSDNNNVAPADSEFKVEDLEGEGRIRKATVYSNVSDEGNYYLWVRAVVGEIEKEECFGPYAIKDHTMLAEVTYGNSLTTSGFLGNDTVKRSKIKSITIKNTLDGHNKDDANTWDVTANGNGRYLAWYEGDEANGYDVTIAGEGGVVANTRPAYLFKNIGSGIENGEVTITGLENLDTGLVTGSMTSMFENCKATSLDLSNFDTRNVTSMSNMFCNCSHLTSLDLTNFDTRSVKNMKLMFNSCSVTNIDLSNFDTSNVTTMQGMFMGCKVPSLNLSNFDTRNVTTMDNIFRECSNLIKLDLSSFQTPKVTMIDEMFMVCSKLEEIDFSNFEAADGLNIKQMFYRCNSLKKLDIRKFDITNTTGYDAYWMSTVPNDCNIIVNATMKEWFTENLSSYTNVNEVVTD